jgi:hypothetical protein
MRQEEFVSKNDIKKEIKLIQREIDRQYDISSQNADNIWKQQQQMT